MNEKKSQISKKTHSSVPSRYTKNEKEILFSLFQHFEETIDIRRRKSYSKKLNNMTVRQCWQKICTLYNSDPNITTQRSIKQIQKFWLNSR